MIALLLALPVLADDQVHLWILPEPEEFEVDRSILSVDEIHRANSFSRERDARRFSVCRSVLRDLLAGYVSVVANDLEFGKTATGKSSLTGLDEPWKKLSFNEAHCDGMVLFAFAQTEVEVDVERIQWLPDMGEIVTLYATQSEIRCLLELQRPSRASVFFRSWTMREVYAKRTGEGLAAFETAKEIAGIWSAAVRRISPFDRFDFQDEASVHRFFDCSPRSEYAVALCTATEVESFISFEVKRFVRTTEAAWR